MIKQNIHAEHIIIEREKDSVCSQPITIHEQRPSKEIDGNNICARTSPTDLWW
jgi:hypothetical protein